MARSEPLRQVRSRPVALTEQLAGSGPRGCVSEARPRYGPSWRVYTKIARVGRHRRRPALPHGLEAGPDAMPRAQQRRRSDVLCRRGHHVDGLEVDFVLP